MTSQRCLQVHNYTACILHHSLLLQGQRGIYENIYKYIQPDKLRWLVKTIASRYDNNALGSPVYLSRIRTWSDEFKGFGNWLYVVSHTWPSLSCLAGWPRCVTSSVTLDGPVCMFMVLRVYSSGSLCLLVQCLLCLVF